MRPGWKRLLATVPLVGAAVLGGCRVTGPPSTTASGKAVTYCEIIADPPVAASHKIDAPGRFRCDGGGASTILITVSLQKQGASGAWSTLATQAFVAHDQDTSRARSEAQRTRDVSIDCATGQFRTLVHAVETSGGARMTYDVHSVTVPSPCSFRP